MNARKGWLLLMVMVTTVAGCKQRKTPATPAPPAAAQQTLGGDSQQAPPTAAEPPKPLDGEVHPFMTSQLRVFIQQNGRLPADFGELARARLDAVPRAPPGMTWAIDPATQEVKLIKK